MMKLYPINNFTVVESVYGKFIVNRHCDFQIDSLAKTGKTHEEPSLHKIFEIVDSLADGAIMIDGGTNIGLVCIPVGQRVKERNISIIGFEPQRLIYDALCGTIALNDLSNIWLHNKALGDQEGTVVLPDVDYGTKFDYGTVSVKKTENNESCLYMRRNTVDCVTIDSMNIPRVDFIKLDVEGFECPTLRGARETIKKNKPILWIEHHLAGKENIERTLNEIHPYNVEIASNQDVLCTPV